MIESGLRRVILATLLSASVAACGGSDGADGDPGAAGERGEQGEQGEPGENAIAPLDSAAPLSSVVALGYRKELATQLPGDPDNLAAYIKALVTEFNSNTPPGIPGMQFPLTAGTTDTVRAIKGLQANVVASWLDPLRYDADPVEGPLLGANADYIAYFGDNRPDAPASPIYQGDDTAGWMWVNHEYISGKVPQTARAPIGQHMIMAQYFRFYGMLSNDIAASAWDDTSLTVYTRLFKKQLGGTWMHIIQDPSSGEWEVDLGANNIRYDATDATRLLLSGLPNGMTVQDHDDANVNLPQNVVAGIMGDCSGAQTPWGTVVTAEENVQDYYGDLEAGWDTDLRLVAGRGFDPGAPVSLPVQAATDGQFGQDPDTNTHHDRNLYGYLSEIDPGKPADEYLGKTNAGQGHRKLGAVGRARWENTTFVTNDQWQLDNGQKIVLYAGNDRYGGRIYKFVSDGTYATGMTSAEIRALLDNGTVYVAHFTGLDNDTGITVGGNAPAAQPGQWIALSVDNTDDNAPNAAALTPDTKVGAALQDNNWNGLAGFANDYQVGQAMFTAATKIGVKELNRPEDVEWNPANQKIYVAFTKHNQHTALNADGTLRSGPLNGEDKRTDNYGTIFELTETEADPASSTTFTYTRIFAGSVSADGRFSAANPDNLMIDADGGLWFGTDGNFSTTSKDSNVPIQSDALYYLDYTPDVADSGQPFRVAAVPSDAEATGPAFSSQMGTLFFSVQHPGEKIFSSWPQRE